MPEAMPNKRYTGESKQEVIERMHQEQLSMRETARMAYLTSIREYILNERASETQRFLKLFSATVFSFLRITK